MRYMMQLVAWMRNINKKIFNTPIKELCKQISRARRAKEALIMIRGKITTRSDCKS